MLRLKMIFLLIWSSSSYKTVAIQQNVQACYKENQSITCIVKIENIYSQRHFIKNTPTNKQAPTLSEFNFLSYFSAGPVSLTNTNTLAQDLVQNDKQYRLDRVWLGANVITYPGLQGKNYYLAQNIIANHNEGALQLYLKTYKLQPIGIINIDYFDSVFYFDHGVYLVKNKQLLYAAKQQQKSVNEQIIAYLCLGVALGLLIIKGVALVYEYAFKSQLRSMQILALTLIMITKLAYLIYMILIFINKRFILFPLFFDIAFNLIVFVWILNFARVFRVLFRLIRYSHSFDTTSLVTTTFLELIAGSPLFMLEYSLKRQFAQEEQQERRGVTKMISEQRVYCKYLVLVKSLIEITVFMIMLQKNMLQYKNNNVQTLISQFGINYLLALVFLQDIYLLCQYKTNDDHQ